MEDTEVNTNVNNNFTKPNDVNMFSRPNDVNMFSKPNDLNISHNILFKPTFERLELEDNKRVNQTNINQHSVLNRSSMMTYGKMYYLL